MPAEDFTLRITRKGEIILEVEGLPPRRVKELVEYFEETLGPVRVVDAGGDPDARGRVLDDALAQDYQQEDETERPRLNRFGKGPNA